MRLCHFKSPPTSEIFSEKTTTTTKNENSQGCPNFPRRVSLIRLLSNRDHHGTPRLTLRLHTHVLTPNASAHHPAPAHEATGPADGSHAGPLEARCDFAPPCMRASVGGEGYQPALGSFAPAPGKPRFDAVSPGWWVFPSPRQQFEKRVVEVGMEAQDTLRIKGCGN